MKRRSWICLVVAVGVGALTPWVELWWKCRAGREASESCVWARSYMPLSRVVEPIIVAPLTLALLCVLAALFDRLRRRT